MHVCTFDKYYTVKMVAKQFCVDTQTFMQKKRSKTIATLMFSKSISHTNTHTLSIKSITISETDFIERN